MIDREQIGLRISVLRKKAGLSQAELSEKLGISAQAVSKWESGKNYPISISFVNWRGCLTRL